MHAPAGVFGLQALHALAHVQARAALLQPAQRRFGPQIAQRHARQQQVGAAAHAKKRIAQHAQKNRAAGLMHGRVQGRDAKRLDEIVQQLPRQATAQIGHARLRAAGKAAALPGQRPAQQRQPRAPGPAARAGNAPGGVQRRGQPAGGGQRQPRAIGVGQRQRQTQQQALRLGAHQPHQPQRFAVSAYEDVLAVVCHDLAAIGQQQGHGARAPAAAAAGLKHAHCQAALRRPHRRRQPGPARANDGNAPQRAHGGRSGGHGGHGHGHGHRRQAASGKRQAADATGTGPPAHARPSATIRRFCITRNQAHELARTPAV